MNSIEDVCELLRIAERNVISPTAEESLLFKGIRLFTMRPKGAKASAVTYSIIETEKVMDINI